MSQNEEIILYLKEHGSITPKDAEREFGCMRLASRIHDIRQMGYSINAESESFTGRNGRKGTYARYVLKEMKT